MRCALLYLESGVQIMNVFLVGNGYDLHHAFPTSYINFVNVVCFLSERDNEEFATVGKVLGNIELQNKDEFIKKCYNQHFEIYNEALLPQEEVATVVDGAKKSCWFNYFRKCVSKNIKWIDLEKEILTVISAFEAFFEQDGALTLSNNNVIFDLSAVPENKEHRFIIEKFGFFFEEMSESRIGRSRMMRIKDEYVVENVIGSQVFYLDTEKIVSFLYDDLCDVMLMLRLYMQLFVDGPAKEYARREIKPHWPHLPTPQSVYSFNYTNTIELLYGNNMVDHIHGNTNSDIVLGVNPDEHDEVYSIDTTFLQFKKYFQRTFSKTDLSFIHKMRFAKKTPRSNDTTLTVIGHSLDITDKDIIMQIFDSAKEIKILYHSDSSIKNQIKNLVRIYGKTGFDELRDAKALQFLPQNEIEWVYPNQ